MMYVWSTTAICHVTTAWSCWRLVCDATCSPYTLLVASVDCDSQWPSSETFDYAAMWGLLLCFVLSVLFALGTAYLLVAQVLAINRNQTMLESWTMPAYFDYQQQSARATTYVGNPYDLGFWDNWAPVIGANPLKWLVPVWSNEGNGVEFEVRDDCIMYRYEEYCTRVAQLIKREREKQQAGKDN
jgi:hypothetical protein